MNQYCYTLLCTQSQSLYLLQTFFWKSSPKNKRKSTPKKSDFRNLYFFSKTSWRCKNPPDPFADYGISISIGRVYRLVKSMNLPKTFNPPASNQVGTTDFSYIPIGEKTFAYEFCSFSYRSRVSIYLF